MHTMMWLVVCEYLLLVSKQNTENTTVTVRANLVTYVVVFTYLQYTLL